MPDRSLPLSRIGARTIPSNPTWFHRLPGILDVLLNMEATSWTAMRSRNCSASGSAARPALYGRPARHPIR